MPTIVFICTANQFRSPIAAACLRSVVELEKPAGEWQVDSAGTWTTAGQPAPSLTVQIGRKLGLKGLENHRTRQVDLKLLTESDLNIVMESGHKEAINMEFPAVRSKTFMLSEVVSGMQYDIPDPARAIEEAAPISRELKTLIEKNANKIFDLASKLRKTA